MSAGEVVWQGLFGIVVGLIAKHIIYKLLRKWFPVSNRFADQFALILGVLTTALTVLFLP